MSSDDDAMARTRDKGKRKAPQDQVRLRTPFEIILKFA